ncbi:MAG: hypothetical protein ACYTKD_26585, partial [Planctomycetota bacterium]
TAAPRSLNDACGDHLAPSLALARDSGRVHRERERPQDVYLDVSGSVHDDLPRILGVLGNMQSDIEKVFTFSNDIVETSLKALAKGEGIRTTYGTDFDCVAASILERGYPKAVMITDDGVGE